MPSHSDSFSLRKIAVAAFGPSLLFGLGEGAILPVIALSAKELGASFALSGFIVALVGIGSLVSNLPAAWVTSRYGERRSMIGAALFSIVALLLCISASSPWVLAVGVFMIGMATSVFLLARQTYLIEAVPLRMRARALSTLGGTMRVGLFAGPFAGAAAMHFVELPGAYWVGILAMAGTGLLSFAIPELTSDNRTQNAARPRSKTVAILRAHKRSYATLGTACALVAAIRACRQVVIPLWAAHIGLDAATTSVIYGLMGAVDMLLFYPAGKVMDSRGRRAVAIPSMLIMALALMLMPLTHGMLTLLLASMLLGFGNGIGSGLIMTIGADASPRDGRTQFLGLWRLITDLGSGGGPLLLSGLTAAASLGAGVFAIGAVGVIAASMFWTWLPRQQGTS